MGYGNLVDGRGGLLDARRDAPPGLVQAAARLGTPALLLQRDQRRGARLPRTGDDARPHARPLRAGVTRLPPAADRDDPVAGLFRPRVPARRPGVAGLG